MDPELHWVVRAWHDLATCRNQGQPQIPWTAIDAYARAHQITDRARFEFLIRSLETAALDWNSREAEDA